MITLFLPLLFLALLQYFTIRACLQIMRSRTIIARDRWLCCLLIFCCPLIGLFIYQAFRNQVSHKEYRFFSDAFVERHLS